MEGRPITAGLAAIIWSANPQLTNQQVLEILKSTSDDLGATRFDSVFGHGRINVYNAMMDVVNVPPVTDTEAPSVTLTSPSNNATVSGVVSITATADDNVAVETVEFRIDGALIATDAVSPFATTVDASSAASGYYLIEAKAFDTSGNASLADTEQIAIEEPIAEVTDSLPPSESILSPSSGSTLNSKTTVTVFASDENGVIEIKVYVNALLTTTRTSGSLTWRWNTRKISKGSHTLRIEARDPAGNVGIDEIVVYK